MAERLTFNTLSNLAELYDYIGPLALDDRKAFEAHMLRWSGIFPDAWEQTPMNDDQFAEWRSGFERERQGTFAGEEWALRFGAILMPERSIHASLAEMKFKAPWGLCLKRLAEAKDWHDTPARRERRKRSDERGTTPEARSRD